MPTDRDAHDPRPTGGPLVREDGKVVGFRDTAPLPPLKPVIEQAAFVADSWVAMRGLDMSQRVPEILRRHLNKLADTVKEARRG